jgi:uncharacterized protein YndB with AHSA1/START domain
MTEAIQLPPIHYNTYIDAPPERVYDTLTTPSGWDAWFTQGAEVDPRPGGYMLFRWVNFKVDRYTAESRGPVLEADRPRRFVFQWTPGDSTTTIEFDLEPLGPGTVLTVTESGHTTSPKDLEALVECASGWGEAVTLLKFYLEHGITYGHVPAP